MTISVDSLKSPSSLEHVRHSDAFPKRPPQRVTSFGALGEPFRINLLQTNCPAIGQLFFLEPCLENGKVKGTQLITSNSIHMGALRSGWCEENGSNENFAPSPSLCNGTNAPSVILLYIFVHYESVLCRSLLDLLECLRLISARQLPTVRAIARRIG